MCGIAGVCDYNEDFSDGAAAWDRLVRRMSDALKRRESDAESAFVSCHAAFARSDPEVGGQPMTAYAGGYRYTIVSDGTLDNADELRRALETIGYEFETASDTEVLLKCYIHCGSRCPEKLSGIFAFAIDDERRNRCFLCRDRFGVKPLFYSFSDGRLIFASEIKALLQYPGIHPVLDRGGLCEIFGSGPSGAFESSVFQGIRSLEPGCAAVFGRAGFSESPYYRLQSYEHPDSYEDTVRHVRYLIEEAVTRRLVSVKPLCGLLSGNPGSYAVAAIAAEHRREHGLTFPTYSFDCTDSGPAGTAPAFCKTGHTRLECGSPFHPGRLRKTVDARDLPGLAEMDSSLLCFCRQRGGEPAAALCGAGEDEIFGGYPRFCGREDPAVWKRLLRPEISDTLRLPDYRRERRKKSAAEIPRLKSESLPESRRRTFAFLALRRRLPALLGRMDRIGAAGGLEIRTPFADHRIVEYGFNAPWSYKRPDGTRPGLLSDAVRPWLPQEFQAPRKSPSPQAPNPAYDRILRHRLRKVLNNQDEPLLFLIDPAGAERLILAESGGISLTPRAAVAKTRITAYLLQINYWLKKYQIRIEL